jgi:hypothetical protein
MANYVSKLSQEEKDQARRYARRSSFEGQMENLIYSGYDKYYENQGVLGDARRVDEKIPNWREIQTERIKANNRLQIAHMVPEGIPEPQLMQDHKLMEQANREAKIKIGNYWSQIAENFALGKNPSYEPISNFPTTPQAPTLSNVNMDVSGQPTQQAPQAPSIFQPQQTQPMPSETIGQYPMQANQFSQEAAAQVNPMLAPQNANASFDFSGQPTPQAPQAQVPATSDAEELERYRRKQNKYSSWGKDPEKLKLLVDDLNIQLDGVDPKYKKSWIDTFDGDDGLKYDPKKDRFHIPKSHRYYEEPVPGLLSQVFKETPLQMDSSANQFARKVGQGFDQFVGDIMRASTPAAELGYKAKPISEVLNVTIPEQSPIYQAPDNNVVTDPFSGEVMVNPEQFLTAEEAQAKAEKEKYAGMDYGQMQMAKAMKRTQLEDNAQAASTASPAAPTQPSPFATSQGAATTVGGQDLGSWLRSGQAPVEGQQAPSMTPQAPVSKFEQESANREARIEQNFGNGQAVSDRERRGTGEMSMEAAVRMAGGDRDKARQMIELQRQGRDPVTGKLSDSSALTESERLARERFDYEKAQDAAKYENASAETRLKRDDEMNTEIGALGTILSQTENVAGVTKEAQGKVGINTAGFFYPLKWIGGTEAASLAGNLETIKSDAFVANITEMRKNSPTGGSVGNVSNKDLETLQSLQTSFRQDLPPQDLRKNLSEYRRIRNKVANDAKNGFIRKYGLVNFNKYFGDDAITQNAGGSNAMASGLTTPSGKKVKIY